MSAFTDALKAGLRLVEGEGPVALTLLSHLIPEIIAAKDDPSQIVNIAQTVITELPAIEAAAKATPPAPETPPAPAS